MAFKQDLIAILDNLITALELNPKGKKFFVTREHLQADVAYLGAVEIIKSFSDKHALALMVSSNLEVVHYNLELLSRLKDDLIKSTGKYNIGNNSSPLKKPIKENKAKINFIYNLNTGDGKFKSNKFRLTEKTTYRKIFDAAFTIRGEKVERQKVLNILGLEDVKPNDPDTGLLLSAIIGEKVRKKDNREIIITEKVNEVVKKIRTKTGLNPEEFVNNGGNIILNI